jgi:hypothetical protein
MNDGGGVALNIRHGVTAGDAEHAYGGGMEIRALAPGWSSPPPDTELGGFPPLVVAVAERDLPTGWESLPRWYWARFDDAFGERYETRNSADPHDPATFERIPSEQR